MTDLIDIATENYQPYLEDILKIENLSFKSPWSINAFKTEIKNPIAHLWALIVDDILIGYICFWMFDSEIQLINLAVHPDKRGQGHGHYLVTKMIDASISKGMQYVWLEVRPSNSAAKRLYQKLGFEEVGCRKRYYHDTNEDAMVMSLPLSQSEGLRSISN